MFLKVYFLNFRYSSLLRSNNLYYIFISPIERLKKINPGVGHLPGSFNLPIFLKEMPSG